MQSFVCAFLALLLFFGCVSQGTKNQPQENGVSKNVLDENFPKLLPAPGFGGIVSVGDGNSISVDLDFNRIYFNFDVDLNSADLDLNVLATSCDSACQVIDANSWKVSKD